MPRLRVAQAVLRSERLRSRMAASKRSTAGCSSSSSVSRAAEFSSSLRDRPDPGQARQHQADRSRFRSWQWRRSAELRLPKNVSEISVFIHHGFKIKAPAPIMGCGHVELYEVDVCSHISAG